MGNFGWIREDSLDAFLEGTAQTPDPRPAPPPTFPCPFCETVAKTRRQLQDHVLKTHSVARPCLHIHGKEPVGVFKVRNGLAAKDVAFFNTTIAEAGIDGSLPAKIQPSKLVDKLISCRTEEVKIKLFNAAQSNVAPAITAYVLSFRVCTPSELKQVELAFHEHVVNSDISLQSVDRFVLDQRCQGPARDYVEGLAKFVVGILQREESSQRTLTTSFAQYRDNYGAAIYILQDIERPLARMITEIIRFAFNEPSKPPRGSGFWELDVANALISGAEAATTVIEFANKPRKQPICPIDHGTARILDFAVRMASQDRWSTVLDDECRATATSEKLDVMDRQKAMAIWAQTAWRLGAHRDAQEPLRQIAATYPFNRWAEPYLEMVTK